MLDMGPDACALRHVNKEGQTALWWACNCGHEPTIRKMMAAGAEGCAAAQSVSEGRSAFHWVVEWGMEDMARTFLDWGEAVCHFNLVNEHGDTPFLSACNIGGQARIAHMILDRFPSACLPFSLDVKGETPLMVCIRTANRELAGRLLDLGAEACGTAHESPLCRTALGLCASNGSSLETMKRLVALGPKRCNGACVLRNDMTALMVAIFHALFDHAMVLLDLGVDGCHARFTNGRGETALSMLDEIICACDRGSFSASTETREGAEKVRTKLRELLR